MTLVTGFETPASVWGQDTSPLLNLTNTAFQPGVPEVGVVFTAPVSGRVELSVGGGGRDNSATNRIAIGYQVYDGPQPLGPNLIHDPDFDEFWIPGEMTESIYGSRTVLFDDSRANVTNTSFRPLQQYYARVVHRVTGGTSCDIFVREIVVTPLS